MKREVKRNKTNDLKQARKAVSQNTLVKPAPKNTRPKVTGDNESPSLPPKTAAAKITALPAAVAGKAVTKGKKAVAGPSVELKNKKNTPAKQSVELKNNKKVETKTVISKSKKQPSPVSVGTVATRKTPVKAVAAAPQKHKRAASAKAKTDAPKIAAQTVGNVVGTSKFAKKTSPVNTAVKHRTAKELPVGNETKPVNKKAAKIVPVKPQPAALPPARSTAAKGRKAAEIVTEAIAPVAAKTVKKKIKPLSSAVLRGKIGKYVFDVFALDAELNDSSAIYVISKRFTDKGGRGHHKFVCIGQTASLLGDIKKHRKDKCIKQHKANVVCLLREDDEANRRKIETDLREAHTIACHHR